MDKRLNPFKIIIIYLMLSIIGISLISTIPLNLNPTNTQNYISLTYLLSDSPPEVVEHKATSPLENALSQITDVKGISSVSNYNGGIIEITFGNHVNLQEKQLEVSAMVRQVYPKLPANLSYPQIKLGLSSADSEVPLLIYSINANMSPYRIKKVVEESIQKQLTGLKGVKSVETVGASNMRYVVRFDREQLRSFGLNSSHIKQLITAQNRKKYFGQIDLGNGQNFFVNDETGINDIKDIESLVLKTSNGQYVRLRDVATVNVENENARSYYRINNRNAIRLVVYANTGINQLNLASKIDLTVNSFADYLPDDYLVNKVYDDTEYIAKELKKIYKRSGLSLMILLVFIILVYRDTKYLFILFSGIVANLCISVVAVKVFNLNIHLYSLAGITISFGLIIDNAIVMLDHIHKKGNQRIFMALLAASLTTIAAISIVFFLPERQRLMLVEFSLIIIINLFISLLVALFLTPAMYKLLKLQVNNTTFKSHAFRKILYKSYWRFVAYTAQYKRSFFIALVLFFGTPVFMLPKHIEGFGWYNKTIGSDFYFDRIKPYADYIFGGTLHLFIDNIFERSGMRINERTKLFINARLNYGYTIENTNKLIHSVENYLTNFEGIDQYITNVYNAGRASIVITFKDEYENTGLPFQLKTKVTRLVSNLGNATWSVYGIGRGFSNSTESFPSFNVELSGYNYLELERQAEFLKTRLEQNERVQNVNTNERMGFNDRPAKLYHLYFDQSVLNHYNINQLLLYDRLQTNTVSRSPFDFIDSGETHWPVYLEETQAAKFSVFDLTQGIISIDAQNLIKLSAVASLQLVPTTNALHKINRQYIRRVGYDYYGSAVFGQKHLQTILAEYNKESPIGYSAKITGWFYNSDDRHRQYAMIPLLIVAVFFICAILFENLKLPFYIILVIPLSFIGLFLTFFLFNFYFDQGGYAALLLLAGLSINASIFIVNDYNNINNRSQNNKVIKATIGKAYPILLTSVSTCLGLVPFLTGGQHEVFWFSFAVGVIGGLIFSLFAIFFCIPVLLFQTKYRAEE